MIIAGVIALCLLSALVCFMWAYIAVQVEKERKKKMKNNYNFWYSEMKEERRCNACGGVIPKNRTALVFRNEEAGHITGLARVRLCPKCVNELATLLDKDKVV